MDDQSAVAVIEPELTAPSLHLVALRPSDMEPAQASLKSWAERKLAEERANAAEADECVRVAEKAKWGRIKLRNQAKTAHKRVTYYEKVKAALDAGYVIIPDFPVEVFAVRTSGEAPVGSGESNWGPRYAQNDIPEIESDAPPLAEGDYKNPQQQAGYAYKHETTDSNGEKHEHWTSDAIALREPEFPFVNAKPVVMNATQEAMARKIFDEIGALPRSRRKPDPVIVGRIIRPDGERLTFMIAWYIRTQDI